MKVLKAIIASSLMIGMASTAQADTLYGLYVDANYWNTEATFTSDGNSRKYDSDGQIMASASLEHGVPMIPNARAKYTTLNASRNLSGLDIDIKANSTDLIAYYEVLDNVVSADIGMGAKMITGTSKRSGIKTDGSGTTGSKADIEEILPMAYASVGAKLPFTGLSAKAELGVAKGDDAEATDAQAELQYNFVENMAVDVGAKVGYRMMNVKYDNVRNEKLETEFKGPYVGMEVHF